MLRCTAQSATVVFEARACACVYVCVFVCLTRLREAFQRSCMEEQSGVFEQKEDQAPNSSSMWPGPVSVPALGRVAELLPALTDFAHYVTSVSYTHLTLPTTAEV